MSVDQNWDYDSALCKFLPLRSQLRQFKPDYAFGIRFGTESAIKYKIQLLPEATLPGVSPVCCHHLTFPFLVIESRSNDGSIRAAENKLSNAMVKAHDILNSLNLQGSYYVLGVVQVERHVRYYLSFSIQQTNGGLNRFADEVDCLSSHATYKLDLSRSLSHK